MSTERYLEKMAILFHRTGLRGGFSVRRPCSTHVNAIGSIADTSDSGTDNPGGVFGGVLAWKLAPTGVGGADSSAAIRSWSAPSLVPAAEHADSNIKTTQRMLRDQVHGLIPERLIPPLSM